MKTAKLIISIISMVIFIIIVFQSCATGAANILDSAITGTESTDTSSGAGMFLAFCVLIGGIVGIATRNSKGGGIAAGIFYIIAAVIGFANLGTFGDLVIWSVLSAIFGAVFLIGSIVKKSALVKSKEEKEHIYK